MSTSPFLAITHHSWTSLNTQSFFTTTVHYVNNDWILKCTVLGTVKLTGSHTSLNISNELKATHTKWNLPPSPIAITDNAANEHKAFEFLNWDKFWYYGHRLNLVLKHSMDTPEMKNLLGKIKKKLVTFFFTNKVAAMTCFMRNRNRFLMDMLPKT